MQYAITVRQTTTDFTLPKKKNMLIKTESSKLSIIHKDFIVGIRNYVKVCSAKELGLC